MPLESLPLDQVEQENAEELRPSQVLLSSQLQVRTISILLIFMLYLKRALQVNKGGGGRAVPAIPAAES